MAALLKRMIACHTGRGLVSDCDCEFCVTKRRLTAEIGNANYLMRVAKTSPQSMRPYYMDWDAVGNWIWGLRKAARRRARIILQQLKEK